MKRIAVSKRTLAYVMGIGMTLFIVHSPLQPLKEFLFLPSVGFFVICVCIYLVLSPFKKWDLGPRYFWIPMLAILVVMVARIVIEPNIKNVGAVGMGVILFGAYLAARKLGAEIFRVIAIVTVIEAVSCVVLGIITPGVKNGGIINYPTRNYDLATALLVSGATVSVFKGQWIVASIALIGLLFTGAEEAMVVGGILGVVVLMRRDWGWRLAVPIGILIVGVIGITFTDPGQELYKPASTKIQSLVTQQTPKALTSGRITPPVSDGVTYPRQFYTEEEGKAYLVRYDKPWEEVLDNALFWRWTQYKRTIENFSWLGHGYEVMSFNFYTAHNVPLIILDQLGPLAVIVYLFIMIAGVVKTQWKYAFAGILALGLFDHLIWTMMAPFWWILCGVSSASNIKSDLVFKTNESESR